LNPVIIAIVAIFTIVGCDLDEDVVTLPSEFIGTWERVDLLYTTTLTFSSTTLKASNQSYYWELQSISGYVYSIKTPSGSDYTSSGTITIKLIDGNLDIIDRKADSTSSG